MSEKWQKIKHFIFDSSLFVVVYKVFEELVARATLIAVSNIFSIVFCVTFTQCLQVILKKFFKMFISKKGVDEVKFIKNAAKLAFYNGWVIYLCLLSVFTGYCAYVILPFNQIIRIIIGSVLLVLGVCGSIQVNGKSLEQINAKLADKGKANAVIREKKEQERKIAKEKKIDRKNNKVILKAQKEQEKLKYKELVKKQKEELKKFKESVLQASGNEISESKENLPKE